MNAGESPKPRRVAEEGQRPEQQSEPRPGRVAVVTPVASRPALGAPGAPGDAAGHPAHDLPLWETIEVAIEEMLDLPEPPRSRWARAGLSARGEK